MDFEKLASGSDAKTCRMTRNVVVSKQYSYIAAEWNRDLGSTYNKIILDTVGLAPSAHDKGVIVGDDDDLINALGLESIPLLEE